jgi:hypothetical protein
MSFVRITLGSLPNTFGFVQTQPVFVRNTLGELEDKTRNHEDYMKNGGRNGLSAQPDPSTGQDQPKIVGGDIASARPRMLSATNNMPVDAADMHSKQSHNEPTPSRFGRHEDTIESAAARPHWKGVRDRTKDRRG